MPPQCARCLVNTHLQSFDDSSIAVEEEQSSLETPTYPPPTHFKPTFERGMGQEGKHDTPSLLVENHESFNFFSLSAETVVSGPNFTGFVWAEWDERRCRLCGFQFLGIFCGLGDRLVAI